MIVRKDTWRCTTPKRWESKIDLQEGERIEEKLARVVEEGEAISDGAPLIFTPKEDGVIAAYNIRTDRWEIAQDAMEAAYKADAAKSKAYKTKPNEEKSESPEESNTETQTA